MIPKRIPMKKVNLSSFAKLTDYITHAQGKNERVGKITITNCNNTDDPWWAAQEIEGIQRQNIRTKLDKTYHLLISFRLGENPAPEILQKIEERFARELGYGEHQRISAVHHDTDHLHIHIAINKIHPTKLIAIEPYYDKRKLGDLAAKMEVEYGLEPDNHVPRMTRGEAKAQDMEKSAGIESLIGWVKRGCLNDLLAADSWEALHAALADNGLQIIPRGNGLIITNGTIGAKASSIDRKLSKKTLEDKLGMFQASTIAKGKSQGGDGYKIRPMASKVDTRALWQQYQQERMQRGQGQSLQVEKAKERRDRRIKAVKEGARIKRMAIKLLQGGIAKRILYHQVSQGLLKDIKQINQAYQNERASYAQERGNRLIWHDWLKAKAQAGNTQALEVLRARYEREFRYGNVIARITPGNDNMAIKATDKIDTVTKRGTVHIKVVDGIVRDDGRQLRMSDNLSDAALKAALQLAVKRYGTLLQVQGTDKFYQALSKIAATAPISITLSKMDAEKAAQQAAKVRKPFATNKSRIEEPGQIDSSPRAWKRADDYIAMRNESRQKGYLVIEHRRYNTEKDAGTHGFGGIRQAGTSKLMLLKTSSEVLVLPIEDKMAYQVWTLKLGSPIEISSAGIIQPRVPTQALYLGRVRELTLTRGGRW